MNENYDHCHHRKTKRTFIYTKSEKNCDMFLYTKSQSLIKKLDNSRYVFIYKKPYIWRYGIFMKFLKLAFINKKHDTLRYVTFLYTKSYALRKKQDNLRYVFMYKNPALLLYAIFHWIFWNLRRGGTFIHSNNNIFFVTFLYWKNNALCVTLLYTKRLTLCVTF